MRRWLHESTHAWQYQHMGPGYIASSLLAQGEAMITDGDRNKAYEYDGNISGQKDWSKWNAEQQAAAMEDYYKATIGDVDLKKTTPEAEMDKLAPYVQKVKNGDGAA